MKKVLVCLIMVTAFALTGCAMTNSGTGRVENISAADAKEKALLDSGINEADIKNISTELKSKDKREYYEVDFITDNEEVSYDVDALTGAILGSKHEKKGAPVNTETPEASAQTQTPAQTPATQTPAAPFQNQTLTQTPVTPSQNQAPTTQTPAQSQIQDLTNSGTAPKKETVNTQPAKEPQLVPATGGILSEAQVKELVLARIPGATNADFVEFHKDYDDGRMEYEGKVIYQYTEYEFEIDAYSGAFRDWDVEFWPD